MEKKKYRGRAHLQAKGEEEYNEQEEELIRDVFQCCICLDLIYKPVVIGCGHISCFWCIFNAINSWRESRCPICRYSYNHFPNACQLLHFLLLKIYPIAYRRRDRQVKEEEKRFRNFSPQFDDNLLGSHLSEQSLPQAIAHSANGMEIVPSISSEGSEETKNAAIKTCGSTQKNVTIADLLCIKCKNLLFRPVVLNCGHVYCESCIIVPTEEIPRCQVCESLHPGGLPNVCKVLEDFLGEQFAEQYAKRQEGTPTQAQRPVIQSSVVPSVIYSSWLLGNGPKFHVGVGCDSCGMIPLIGDRYKCKDCVNKMGFDLCEACYNNPSKVSGRFNQQHKPEHSFEVLQPQSAKEYIFRFNSQASEGDGSDSSEDAENGSLAVSSNDIPEDAGNSLEGIEDNSTPTLLLNLTLDEEDNFDAH